MANPFLVSCPVWGFVHTRFQISNKEFVIISMKDISGQLELKYIKAKNLKIKRSRFGGESRFVWIALGWLRVWFSGGRHNFPSLSLVSAFSLYCFYRSFSPWFNRPFLSPQSLFDSVRLRQQNFPRIQWAIYVVCARVSETCVSLVGGMTQLTAALMRCDKLLKL